MLRRKGQLWRGMLLLMEVNKEMYLLERRINSEAVQVLNAEAA